MTGYSPFSTKTMDDPSSNYQWLHAQAPVHYLEDHDPPFYTLSRYADVEAALRDGETYSSEWGQGPSFTQPAGMLSNPPQHTYYRRLVQPAFTPGAIGDLAPRIERLAHDLLDKVADGSQIDIHDDYAFPLPVIIISELLGVPEEDIHLFKDWSDASVEAMGAEDPTPWAAKLQALTDYQRRQIEERRAMETPPNDLITMLVNVRREGKPLPDAQILSVINQLLVGGNETTTSLITNCVWRLLERRELWERVAADPSLIDTAIEESLRFDPPVLGLYRTTTRDVTLHGVTIPENTKVMLHYAAANRDAEIFPDPDVFSLDRPAARHMAFGLGIHFCLGAELARLEARLALQVLAQRLPGLTLESAGERIKPFFLWGRRKLPVAVA